MRWFEFGATNPIFRQHGARETEIWKYGPVAEAAITKVIKWRVSMKDYLTQQLRKLSTLGRYRTPYGHEGLPLRSLSEPTCSVVRCA